MPLTADDPAATAAGAVFGASATDHYEFVLSMANSGGAFRSFVPTATGRDTRHFAFAAGFVQGFLFHHYRLARQDHLVDLIRHAVKLILGEGVIVR